MTRAQELRDLLQTAGWSNVKAGELLKVDRNTIYRYMNQAKADDGEDMDGQCLQPSPAVIELARCKLWMENYRKLMEEMP